MEVFAVVISAVALAVSAWGVWYSKRSADASDRSAKASDRAAAAGERQAAAAEAALPPPPPPVAWRVEWVQNKRYLLRNIGVGTATGLQIDARSAHPLAGLGDTTAPIPPNGSVSFLITGSMGRPSPTELWLTWDGQDDPVVVPVT